MRFPEEKIKEAILSSDPNVQLAALAYFFRAYSRDPDLMCLTIQACKSATVEQRTQILIGASKFPQTDETMDWVIDEVNGSLDKVGAECMDNLAKILIEANAELFLPRVDAILAARNLPIHFAAPVRERQRLLSLTESELWAEFESRDWSAPQELVHVL